MLLVALRHALDGLCLDHTGVATIVTEILR